MRLVLLDLLVAFALSFTVDATADAAVVVVGTTAASTVRPGHEGTAVMRITRSCKGSVFG